MSLLAGSDTLDPDITVEKAVKSDDPAPHDRALDHALIRGIGWTWIANWGTQVVSWASTILVARLLIPSDYGIVAMATVFLGLARIMSEFGLGSAILALRSLNQRQLAELNSLSLLLGAAATAAAMLAAIPLGHFFDSAELPPVVMAMSVSFLLAALRVVPYALLQRALRFDALARIEVLQALVMTGTTLGLAFAGAGYWSLALGPLVGQAAVTVANLQYERLTFARPSKELGAAISFSRNVLVERLAGYGYSSADALIIGRMLGDGPLGVFTLARSLGAIAVDKVTGMTMRVTPAIFSAAQHDHAGLRRYMLLLTEGLAVATFPICVGTALVAPEFVAVFLGPEWKAATVPLQLIAIQGIVPSVTSIFPQILLVVGESRFVMRNGVAALIFVPAAMLVAVRYGVVGVAASWLLCAPLIRAPLFWRLRASIGVRTRQFGTALWPAASATAVMVVAVTVTQRLLPSSVGDMAHLAIKIAVGAGAYGLAIAGFHRERVDAVIASLRSFRNA